jgi:hypothetical protein
MRQMHNVIIVFDMLVIQLTLRFLRARGFFFVKDKGTDTGSVSSGGVATPVPNLLGKKTDTE